MQTGRVLALDYGTKNVGLACSDELRILVRPLASIPISDFQVFLDRLEAAIDENNITELVVGIPLNMDGTRGRSVELVERFIARLKQVLDVPLTKFDERLSTVEALDLWKQMGRKRQQKYRTIDSLAAAMILERYLREGGICAN